MYCYKITWENRSHSKHNIIGTRCILPNVFDKLNPSMDPGQWVGVLGLVRASWRSGFGTLFCDYRDGESALAVGCISHPAAFSCLVVLGFFSSANKQRAAGGLFFAATCCAFCCFFFPLFFRLSPVQSPSRGVWVGYPSLEENEHAGSR